MIANIDIENANTQKVTTITVPIIVYDLENITKFDISNISKIELKMLNDAIDPKLKYTDIEMFYVDEKPGLPHFGPDYEFSITDNVLIADITKRLEWERKKNNGK